MEYVKIKPRNFARKGGFLGKEQRVGLGKYLANVRKLIRTVGIVTGLEVSDRRVPPETVEQILKEGKELQASDERDFRTRTRRN